MTIFEAFLIGLVQGLTEFMPISSSGHLVLAENFLQLKTTNFFYLTIVTHVATLFAVLIYFRATIWNLIKGFFKLDKSALRLVSYIVLATLPVVFGAVFFNDFIESKFNSANSVLFCFLITGIYFLVVEYIASKIPQKKDLNYKNTLLIGLSQAVALFPGVSRSGSTLATGVALGLSRTQAAEFSFLLAIPTIIGAAIFTLKDGVPVTTGMNSSIYLVSFVTALIAGYISIWGLLKLYKNHSLKGFAYYLLILGVLGVVF